MRPYKIVMLRFPIALPAEALSSGARSKDPYPPALDSYEGLPRGSLCPLWL